MRNIDKIREIFLREYVNGSLKNSYIFECKDVQTAINFAYDISKVILDTDNPDIVPDFTSVKKQDMSVDTIRNIIKNCRVKPFKSKKIYIFEDDSKFNISMQNAFLKTLEEPPQDVIFILTTQNSSNFLDTVRSRCMTYILDEDETNVGQREGIALLVKKLLDIVSQKDEVGMIEYIQEIKNIKDDANEYLAVLLDNLRNMMIAKENIHLIQNKFEQKGYIHDAVSKLSYYELLAIIDLAERSRRKLVSNCSFSMTMETMLLNIMEVRI